MKRRDFIKYSAAGLAGLWVGANLPPWVTRNKAYAATVNLDFTITDALKNMATNNFDPVLSPAGNVAQCYFWLYKSNTPALAPEVPGPIIFAFEGDTINVTLRNTLPQAHNFAVPAAGITIGPVAAGTPTTPTVLIGSFTAPAAGTYLYYDSENPPVGRVMGLHGALIVMPVAAATADVEMPVATSRVTPYTAPPAGVQALFDDLGLAPWWPGLAWQAGATNPDRPDIFGNVQAIPPTPPFRQYIWLLHQASPLLFADVGNTAGVFNAATFVDRFLNDPLVTQGANKAPVENDTPQYFTISGQSGHFSHNTPFICPILRCGEPCVIRVLNAGLWTHSMHIHANHVYVLAVNNQFNVFPDLGGITGTTDNHIWIDTYTSKPLDTWDWLVPYMRCPDVPNSTGNGRYDLHTPLTVDPRPVKKFGVVVKNAALETLKAGNTVAGVSTWPPRQELNMAIPKVGKTSQIFDPGTGKFIKAPNHVPLSPLCFPMHDHSEPSQTSQGGNYNTGLIAGLNFSGDRTLDVPFQTFPNAPVEFGPDFNDTIQEAAGPLPPFEEVM